MNASSRTENLFPLMAWNWLPAVESRIFERMRDCGLNIAGMVNPAQLEICRAASMRAIVADPRTFDYDWHKIDAAKAARNVRDLIAEVNENPAVFGYYIRDEPDASLFPGLAKVAALVKRYAPGKWPYINLFPNYASRQQLGSPTYAAHLDQFARVCKPPIMSYDNYFFMRLKEHQTYYWQNLELMRAASLRYRVPFWNIVLSVAHFHYREPTAADIRLQVFSSLAYGARGLSYFTYLAPDVGNYRLAPVDQFGAETATWQHLQHVNRQVQALAPVFLKLNSTAVYHIGEIPPGSCGPGEESILRDGGYGNLVVGELRRRGGMRYLFVVNKDMRDSVYMDMKFRHAPRHIRLVSPYTGAHSDFAGEQLWLAPGQGSLLAIE